MSQECALSMFGAYHWNLVAERCECKEARKRQRMRSFQGNSITELSPHPPPPAQANKVFSTMTELFPPLPHPLSKQMKSFHPPYPSTPSTPLPNSPHPPTPNSFHFQRSSTPPAPIPLPRPTEHRKLRCVHHPKARKRCKCRGFRTSQKRETPTAPMRKALRV